MGIWLKLTSTPKKATEPPYDWVRRMSASFTDNVIQIQKALVAAGYAIKVDGQLGTTTTNVIVGVINDYARMKQNTTRATVNKILQNQEKQMASDEVLAKAVSDLVTEVGKVVDYIKSVEVVDPAKMQGFADTLEAANEQLKVAFPSTVVSANT